MNNLNLSYFRPTALIISILLIAVGVILAKWYFGVSVAIVSFISLALVVIAKYLWRTPPFHFLFWTDDFSGTYEGTLKYTYIDDEGIEKSDTLKHMKVITQNGVNIAIHSFTWTKGGNKSSSSSNIGLFVQKTSDDMHYEILYSYRNEGSIDQKFPPHYGTEHLKFHGGKNKAISGFYFTNREPFQTRGMITLEWKNKETNHPF